MGANRSHLIVQFLGESVLTALLALLVALALVEVFLPAYGRFLDRPLTLHYLADWPLLGSVFALAVAAGLFSGSYPALVLSSFRPAAVLKADKSGLQGPGLLRTTLAVAQFSVSIGLTVVAFVVFAQINYERNLEMGFRQRQHCGDQRPSPVEPATSGRALPTSCAPIPACFRLRNPATRPFRAFPVAARRAFRDNRTR